MVKKFFKTLLYSLCLMGFGIMNWIWVIGMYEDGDSFIPIIWYSFLGLIFILCSIGNFMDFFKKDKDE